MLRACDARYNHSERPKKIRKRSTVGYAKSLQPLERSSSVSVVEVAVDEAKELVKSLRPAGVGIQAPVHLRKKIVEHGGEVGGRRSVSDNGFHNNLLKGSFPTTDPVLSVKALYTSFVAHNQNVRQSSLNTP